MVCPRCEMVVTDILRRLGLHPEQVVLGRADLASELTPELKEKLVEELQAVGFELAEDPESQMVNAVKQFIMQLVLNPPASPQPLSALISQRLKLDYNSVSRTFSAKEGKTIESYAIGLRVERVKELLEYGHLSIKQIAFKLGYSSVAHLSRQFKKVTGQPPSAYRSGKDSQRRPISEC